MTNQQARFKHLPDDVHHRFALSISAMIVGDRSVRSRRVAMTRSAGLLVCNCMLDIAGGGWLNRYAIGNIVVIRTTGWSCCF